MKISNNLKWILFLSFWCLSILACQGDWQQHSQDAAGTKPALQQQAPDTGLQALASDKQDVPNELKVPAKVYRIAGYIERKGRAPKGYVGGRIFQNREKILPREDSYKEYDVNPRIKGQNRGPERLVISGKGDRYYTADHYQKFQKF